MMVRRETLRKTVTRLNTPGGADIVSSVAKGPRKTVTQLNADIVSSVAKGPRKTFTQLNTPRRGGCWANVGPSGANRSCMCDGSGLPPRANYVGPSGAVDNRPINLIWQL